MGADSSEIVRQRPTQRTFLFRFCGIPDFQRCEKSLAGMIQMTVPVKTSGDGESMIRNKTSGQRSSVTAHVVRPDRNPLWQIEMRINISERAVNRVRIQTSVPPNTVRFFSPDRNRKIVTAPVLSNFDIFFIRSSIRKEKSHGHTTFFLRLQPCTETKTPSVFKRNRIEIDSLPSTVAGKTEREMTRPEILFIN